MMCRKGIYLLYTHKSWLLHIMNHQELKTWGKYLVLYKLANEIASSSSIEAKSIYPEYLSYLQ